MTKSELIEKLADKLSHLSAKEVEKSIKEILELIYSRNQQAPWHTQCMCC
jgi:nucleoid DNA-binding protein